MKNGRRSKQKQRGIVKVNSRGTGYIKTPGVKEDIEIEHYFLKTALNGDEVFFVLHPKVKNRPLQGEVVQISKRAKNQYVGVLEKSGKHYFLKPDDRKMYRDIIVAESPASKKAAGKKILVKITSWGDHKKNPEGRIVKV
jgi:ribonuclease R